MPATTMIHVRLDEDTKEQAEAAFDAMGLSMSEGVRLFLHRVAADQALPFELKVPNAVTRAAMDEARHQGKPRFTNPAALLESLEGE